MSTSFFERMQSLDRRWIYLVLIAVLVVSLLLGKPSNPPVVQHYAQKLFTAVDDAPAAPGDNKIILVSLVFSPSTLGESGNQARVLLRHLMLRKKRFAIVAPGEANGAIIGNKMTREIAQQYGYEYGKDWISFGFQPGVLAFYTAFPRDIQGFVKNDGIYSKPLAGYPIMKGIKDISNVSMVVEVTASASIFSWIAYVQGRYPLKLGYACTGVMVAEAYPYLDSGQLIGMMAGLKGAADYEKLTDDLQAKEIADGSPLKPFDFRKMRSIILPPARNLMFTQSAAHLAIIFFILVGNVGYFLARRRPRTTEQKESV